MATTQMNVYLNVFSPSNDIENQGCEDSTKVLALIDNGGYALKPSN
jgi:hypothetical protein